MVVLLSMALALCVCYFVFEEFALKCLGINHYAIRVCFYNDRGLCNLLECWFCSIGINSWAHGHRRWYDIF